MADHDTIIKLLGSDDPDEIREGAFEAGEEQVEEAVPALAALVHSDNLGVQEAVDRALRKIGGRAVVGAMIPLLREDNAPVRNIAMDILREVGCQDFQALIPLLHDDDPDIRIFVSDIFGSVGSVMAVQPLGDALLKDPEVNVRYQAAVSLGNLECSEAAAYLNKAMADEEWVQFAVIEALKKIKDESSVGALASALGSSSDLVASMIVEALGEMGNIKAVPVLSKQMEVAPTPLRNIIIKAIVNIMGGKSLKLLGDKEREKFRQYMLVALEDGDPEIQDAAILGLGFVGGEAATANIIKIAAKLDPERDAERLDAAIGSLAVIGANASLEAAVQGAPYLDSERGAPYLEALVAVQALSRISDPASAKVLTSVFWDKERDMQREIIGALVKVADESQKAFFLDVLARHEDGTVLKSALYFLGQVLRAPDVSDNVCTLLDHPFDDVKEAALEGCIAIGGEGMIDLFRSMLDNEDPIQRMMAVYAMGKLGVERNLDEIGRALEDEVPDIRKIALESLEGVLESVGLDIVAPRLYDENREVRLAVVELLGKAPGPGVVEYLLHALDDDDDWVRVRAIEALGARGEKEGIPKLVEALSGPSQLVTLKAVEALGEIGGQTAFRALMDIVGSDDYEIQSVAEEAIAKIQEQGVDG